MKTIIFLLILICCIEGIPQSSNTNILSFTKDDASLNSNVLFKLSQLRLDSNDVIIINNALSNCDSITVAYNNCLYLRRAETLRDFFISQGIDSTMVNISFFPKQHLFASDDNTSIKHLSINELNTINLELAYEQMAYAVNPSLWQKKTGPEMGR